jgi:hypothetical protein
MSTQQRRWAGGFSQAVIEDFRAHHAQITQGIFPGVRFCFSRGAGREGPPSAHPARRLARTF